MPSYPAKNVTFRTYTVYADLIQQAADAAGQSISEYCRDRMTPIAAKDLGVPVPKLPDMKRGRDNELVTRASALMGLTPEEFMRQASARMAAAALGYEEAEPTPPPQPRLSPRAERNTPAPRKRRMG